MLDKNDFNKKQIIFLFSNNGDALSFKNDNLIVKNDIGEIKHQSTCYRIFLLCIVGDITITSGLIKRAKKFGFTICLMTNTMKIYQMLTCGMEGNTLLRKKQYEYERLELAKFIVENKIENQKNALSLIRNKNDLIKEAIINLNNHILKLKINEYDLNYLMGIEGSASRVYFSNMFNNTVWNGRKPRIKNDFLNATLDIGYTILFNFIEALLNIFGFDTYYGVLHRRFYMRKSLVCDIMESARPIIDYQTRKAINLGQCKESDFKVINSKYRQVQNN